MQDELDHRSTVRLNGEPLTEPGSAMLISFILDMGVPPRLQLSETQRVLKMMNYESMSKRELLKALFNAWHKLGFPHPRGFVFPNVIWTQNYVAMAFDLVSSMRSGALDPASLSLEELAEVIYERAKIYGIAR